MGNYCIGGQHYEGSTATFPTIYATGIYFGEVNIGGREDYLSARNGSLAQMIIIIIVRKITWNSFMY